MVDIEKMQYGFISGRGNLDAVFVLRKLTEKFRAKNKKFMSLYKGCKAAAHFL